MTIINIELSEKVLRRIVANGGDPQRLAVEGVLVAAYARGLISCGLVGEELGLASAIAASELLGKYRIYPNTHLDTFDDESKPE